MSDKKLLSLLPPDELNRIDIRCKELTQAIATINSYTPYLRQKYYTVLIHSIKLLLQYTLILQENEIK